MRGLTLGIAAALLLPAQARAHCDTLDGPVVSAARLALQRGDVTPLLAWVRPGDEESIRAAFARTLGVRTLGREAQELADQFFFETLVRVHPAGEGMPYTGIEPAGRVEPGIALADAALEKGAVEPLAGAPHGDGGR